MFETFYIFFKKKIGKILKIMEKKSKKRFIRKSQLLVKYLIFFIFKNNEKLDSYIDYQNINNITI